MAHFSVPQNGRTLVDATVLHPARHRSVLGPEEYFVETTADSHVRCWDAIPGYGKSLNSMHPINHEVLTDRRVHQVLVADASFERAYYDAVAADSYLTRKVVDVLLSKALEHTGNARRRARNARAGDPMVKYVRENIRDGMYLELLARHVAEYRGALTIDGLRLRDRWSVAGPHALAARAATDDAGFTEDAGADAAREHAYREIDQWCQEIAARMGMMGASAGPLKPDNAADRLKALGLLVDAAIDTRYRARPYSEIGLSPRDFAEGIFNGDRFVPVAEPVVKLQSNKPMPTMDEFRL